MLLALLCAVPCMGDETDGASTDAVKVPVWRRGVLQEQSDAKEKTAPARTAKKARTAKTAQTDKAVKNSSYETSTAEGLEPAGPPLPTQLVANTTASAGAVGCTTACAPSCTTACDSSCPTGAAQGCPTSCAASCGSGGNACSSCGKTGCGCCCGDFWQHRTGAFFEFLYLRPTGVDMAYAFQQNGVGGPGTVPDGSVGVLHPAYTPAFRIGGNYALDCYSSIAISYAQFDSNSSSSLNAPGGVVGGTVQSLVLQPNSVNAGSTTSSDAATYNIGFKTANIDYRRLLMGSECFAVNYSVGVAYGHLQQGFTQTGSFAPPAGVIQNTTSIHYDGGGLRYGLDFQRKIGQRGFSLYGKSYADVLFGQFESTYSQVNTTTTAVQALSNWRDDRVVPMLELELGGAWTSRGGRFRVSAGYYNSFWFNAVTTPQYVQAVQNANYVNLGQTIAFDGLVTRAEFRF
jgi:hypothetical protein